MVLSTTFHCAATAQPGGVCGLGPAGAAFLDIIWLQYESEPGVWLTLTGSTDGKTPSHIPHSFAGIAPGLRGGGGRGEEEAGDLVAGLSITYIRHGSSQQKFGGIDFLLQF